MIIKNLTITIAVCLFTTVYLSAQTYSGPITINVDSGAVTTLSQFDDSPIFNNDQPKIMGERYPDSEPIIMDNNGQPIFESTYIDILKYTDSPTSIGDNTMLLSKTNVSLTNNVIPPDPTVAVGPDHVIALTNNGNGFFIFDKQGNLLRSVNTTQWWSAIYPSQSGDPQILFDHYENRWVMVFMQVDDAAFEYADLIAYSDDADPFGTWYMYRLEASVWGDFPQIGFDDQAIYIAANCFGATQFPRLRIIPKAAFYASNGGPFSYKEIWNISVPNSSSLAFNIRPSFQYSPSGGVHYLFWANRTGANIYSFYKLTDPVNNPVLTGVNISVPFYGQAPNSNQLGGGTPQIESGGSPVRTAPVFRDGYLNVVHAIRNSTSPNYSSLKYLKVDVSNNTLAENVELGAAGFFHSYPAVTVDQDNNVAITFSRSADTEYIGAYYVTRRASDPIGLSSAYALQEGLGNYVQTFGGTRNRWGDYMGIFLDPANNYNMWMFTEYAAGTNTYAVSLGQIRINPFPGVYIFPENQSYDFGAVEVGTASDTLEVLLSNYGVDDLVISSISQNQGDFNRVSDHIFPITLQTFDTLVVKFTFTPTSTGDQTEVFSFTTNSFFNGPELIGKGYQMYPAAGRQLYAISGPQNSGNTAFIDKLTGAGTNIGFSNYTDLRAFAVDPADDHLYAVRSSIAGSDIVRVNSQLGDAYLLYSLPLPELYSISFDTTGQLYGILLNGQIYQIDLSDGSYSLVSTAQSERISFAFDPQTNDLYGTVKNFLGNPKDQIIKIDLASGDTTRIGRTGFNINTVDLAFDESGVLHGIKGTGNTVSDLFKIDKATGTGALVGSTGLKDLTGIAYSINEPSSVEDEEITVVPNEFNLEQNYPNPFNPATKINFSLPDDSNVKLTVYNLLGEVVTELINTQLTKGVHSAVWNASVMSSGIYFYELNATSLSGKKFTQMKKMILLK